MAAILKNLLFASSPELKGQLTRNLVGSIGVTCRSEIAKIVPIVNPSWLPFRVCSNDHPQLTGLPYIFFFKIKNCLNDDLFISCDDRIGKMLHNICISAVAMSLRWATRGPWASCLFVPKFISFNWNRLNAKVVQYFCFEVMGIPVFHGYSGWISRLPTIWYGVKRDWFSWQIFYHFWQGR